ncbi:MAG: UDP-N-acetylmuramoyl-L-alanyl-D-glutamate--2,6-diaminopimelate ligase [Bacteroidales bacterium]
MKLLSDILYKTGILEVSGSTTCEVTSIALDSRAVKPGTLFIAVKGANTNGHDYISNATDTGAIAVICEQIPDHCKEGVTYVKVSDSHKALGQAAANFFDNPSQKLRLVGVTGTNGKTTTATLLYQIFKGLGYKTGLLSTVEVRIQDIIIPASHTTPDAITLNSLLSEMVEAGCDYAFMEVSSHAVMQERIHGLHFEGAVFTNITHDHLDYHQTFNNYLKAKKRFFDGLPSSSFALTNADDRNGLVMVQNTRAKVFTYGLKSMADFKGKVVESQFEGTKLDINGNEVWSQLVGTFNAYNFLAIYGTAFLLDQDAPTVMVLLSHLSSVEGRFDCIRTENGILGVVDYAHTPDAVENVLRTIEEIRTRQETVITIIGAGGDRDKTKRPLMAKIACDLSDKVILTSDNPRSEDPEVILEEMKSGLDPVQKKKVITIANRKEAILTACHLAKPGDIILLAGKGHEKYQEIKGVRYPFDDKQILREALNQTFNDHIQ